MRTHSVLTGVSIIFLVLIFAAMLMRRAKYSEASVESTSHLDERPQDSAEAIVQSYEADRSMFKNRLPSLAKPSPNLRWFPQTAVQGDFANQIHTLLVTPYGPCADLNGNTTGYGLISMHVNPYLPPVPSMLLGSFATKSEATEAAERYCQHWYLTQANKAQTASQSEHMWFTPETVDVVNLPATGARSETQGEESSTLASASAAPPTPQSPPLSEPEVHVGWQLRPNGDEVLIGPSGQCATLTLQSAPDQNKMRVTLSDGTIKMFPVERTVDAMQAAIDHCQATNPPQ